ncbi:MAG: hypothetical protein KC550_02375 [Nanoarchaeota archaeon]|nr:hypothetical protein [Nanoarchaeota archaeon]
MAKVKIRKEVWSVILTLGVIMTLLFIGGVSAISFSLEKGIEGNEIFEREILPLDLSIKINENEREEIINYSFLIFSDITKEKYQCIFDNYGEKLECDELFEEIILNPNLNENSNESLAYGNINPQFRVNILVPEVINQDDGNGESNGNSGNDGSSENSESSENKFNISVYVNTESKIYKNENEFYFIAKNKAHIEDFELSNLSGSSYTSDSFIGEEGIEWNYIESRKSGTYYINDTSLILRGVLQNSSLKSSEIDGGIKYLSFDYKKAFTSTDLRQIEVFINGNSVGVVPEFNDDEVHKFYIDGLNISGSFNIEIKNIGEKQVVIDNLQWDY